MDSTPSASACDPHIHDRALASFLGLAIGDALGATVEFMTPDEISRTHGVHRNIVGGGWLHLTAGEVTDDTEMALALAAAIIKIGGQWDCRVVADHFLDWMKSMPKDIGSTVRRGLRHFMHTGDTAVPEAPENCGNGALMRHLPVVLTNLRNPPEMRRQALEQAWITHRAPLADAAMLNFAEVTRRLVLGATPAQARAVAQVLVDEHPSFAFDPWPGHASGFVVHTVQTAYEAFFSTHDFEGAVVKAVNRGEDADTTGALTGQLAGAAYGLEAIPPHWLKKLCPQTRRKIEEATPALLGFNKF
jgi:ADP-ribosyl-[dinitrogen reductase] hydrolase